MPRSAIMVTRSRKLSLKLVYQLTHKTMICRSKCRPLNRSSIGTNRCISSSSPASFAFAPEPSFPWLSPSDGNLVDCTAGSQLREAAGRTLREHSRPLWQSEGHAGQPAHGLRWGLRRGLEICWQVWYLQAMVARRVEQVYDSARRFFRDCSYLKLWKIQSVRLHL